MKLKKVCAALAVTALTGMLPSYAVHAEEVYSLEPVLVTAERYEKRDIEIPATTAVYKQEELEKTGASTLEDALRFSTGIVFKSETSGSGGGEFLIRGKRRGTLVMVDGIPLNFRTGYYDLDTIPVETVKQVEVIRGGGAVLYGSDTTGGVINIITDKKKAQNQASLSFGNIGRQRHALHVRADALDFNFTYDKKGELLNVSQPNSGKYFDFNGGEKYLYNLGYDVTDKLRFMSSYSDHNYRRTYNWSNRVGPAVYDKRHIVSKEWRNVLNYQDKEGFNANIYVDRATSDTDYLYYDYADKKTNKVKQILDKKYFYNARDEKIGLDMHKEWKNDQNIYLAGLSAQREMYRLDRKNQPEWNKKTSSFTGYKKPSSNSYGRNVYSVFGQWERFLDKKNTMILSARQTWTDRSPDNTEYKQFTPQAQFLHKINENMSWYASYGESFTMPTMSDMYGRGEQKANPGIKPETGKHYEAGLKLLDKNSLWKLAFFKSDVKNFIRLKEDKNGNDMAMNEDSKNRGVELSVETKHKNGWSTNFGVSLSNPKFYDTRYPGKGWQRSYGRVQLNGGISYNHDKWLVSFQGNYLGKRVLEKYQTEVRPLFITSLFVRYEATDHSEIFLDVDNVLDRKDIISHVLSRYNATPINFRLGYKYKF